MEKLTSRKSAAIRHVRVLARDPQLRREEGLFLCDGDKLLTEALRSHAEVVCVFWKERRPELPVSFPKEYLLDEALFDYVSPMQNSPGPLFAVRMQEKAAVREPEKVLLLEALQDPGNVGTVLRTADAFGIDTVILTEGCADLYAPKTVRASMGAVFRQHVLQLDREAAAAFCHARKLPLYAAALSPHARDLRALDLKRAAVAVGSEGQGLSTAMLRMCDGELIIPMCGAAESLNAAMAAAVIMWEMCR